MAAFLLGGGSRWSSGVGVGGSSGAAIISSASVHSAFTFGPELGRGTFGVVYKGSRKKDGKVVAIKEIPKRRLRDLAKLRNEVKVMSTINHKNVIRMLGAFETPGSLHIVLEFCSGGELFAAITADGTHI